MADTGVASPGESDRFRRLESWKRLPLTSAAMSGRYSVGSAVKGCPFAGFITASDAIVEGSVVRFGDRVRITVRLVRAETGDAVWSGSYEKDLGDVLTLQGELAQLIAAQIEASVSPVEHARLAATRAVTPAVYEVAEWVRKARSLDAGTDNL